MGTVWTGDPAFQAAIYLVGPTVRGRSPAELWKLIGRIAKQCPKSQRGGQAICDTGAQFADPIK
jgi:hypothetical protein